MRCWCAKGHAVAGKPPGAALDGRVDSCVVEDGRALLDDGREPAVGCDAGAADGGFGLLRIAWGVGMAAGAVLAEAGSAGLSTGELRTVVASTPEGGGGVVDPVRRSDGATGRHAGEALAGLPEGSVTPAQLSRWRWFHACSVRLQDQILRRVLEGETIPHEEKLFSLFEPHTRWIMKGKAGKPVELGVPLTVLEDQHPFILGWHLQWQGGDVDMAVPLVAACQAQYPELRGCSFDRRFHSPANQQQLAAMLEHVALPAKGRGTEASRKPGKVKHHSWRDAGGIRAWNRRSMRWKAMAWTGCAHMAGQASNAPWVSRSSPPTCIGSDGCCSNGRHGGTIARTHHPIV